MIENRASHRYAKAMLDIASEEQILDQVIEDFRTIEYAVKHSRDLRNLMDRPTVPAQTKARLLKEIFSGKVSPQVEKFLDLMAVKGRSGLLHGIVVSFRKQLDDLQGIVTAEIRSAQNLTQDLKSQIEHRLAGITGKKIKAQYQINSELIGGYTARIGDMMIDASVLHQLERLHETLSEDAGTWTPTV